MSKSDQNEHLNFNDFDQLRDLNETTPQSIYNKVIQIKSSEDDFEGIDEIKSENHNDSQIMRSGVILNETKNTKANKMNMIINTNITKNKSHFISKSQSGFTSGKLIVPELDILS